MIADLSRLHDELFKCEQNSKITAKMAAQISLFKLFNVANSSIVLLTREALQLNQNIACLPRIQAVMFALFEFQND